MTRSNSGVLYVRDKSVSRFMLSETKRKAGMQKAA